MTEPLKVSFAHIPWFYNPKNIKHIHVSVVTKTKVDTRSTKQHVMSLLPCAINTMHCQFHTWMVATQFNSYNCRAIAISWDILCQLPTLACVTSLFLCSCSPVPYSTCPRREIHKEFALALLFANVACEKKKKEGWTFTITKYVSNYACGQICAWPERIWWWVWMIFVCAYAYKDAKMSAMTENDSEGSRPLLLSHTH